MTQNSTDWDASYAGSEPPPWDIGRPQPPIEAIARAGGLHGRVLDCGCGTGEHALLAAAHGADVMGIDLSAQAIRVARAKAEARALTATFEVADALTLQTPQDAFDVVIDCGVFHVFDDNDRARYVAAVRRQLRPGGTLYLICFSDRQPGDWGPRRVTEAELRAAFAAGWVMDVVATMMDVNPVEGQTHVHGWLATAERLADG